MCRSVHIRLSEAEQKARVRWAGALLPIYASIGLVVIAALALHQPRAADQVATAAVSAPAEAGRR